MTQEPACTGCALWQHAYKPRRDESAEYVTWRPCPLQHRVQFVGRAVESGGRTLTAPDARCVDWRGEGRNHGD